MTTAPEHAFNAWLDAFVQSDSPVILSEAKDLVESHSLAQSESHLHAARQLHALVRSTEGETDLLPKWETIMSGRQPGQVTNAAQLPKGPSIAMPVLRTGRQQDTRRWRVAQVAFNLTLVAVLLATMGAGVWRIRGIFGDDDPNQLAFQPTVDQSATPSPTVESDPVSWGGNNGHTSHFSMQAPPVDSLVPRTLVADQRYSTNGMAVAGNLLISVGYFNELEYGAPVSPRMWALDLTTGEILWEVQLELLANIAIANGTIYALHLAQNVETPFLKLMAFELLTGKGRNFEGVVLPVIESGEAIGPIVTGDTVYVADSEGTTFALDAKTGEQRWMAEGDRGSTPPPSKLSPGATGGALVANDDALYVVTGANHVRRLDLETGDVLFDVDVTGEHDGQVTGVTLFLQDRLFVARISGWPGDEDTSGYIQMIPETVAILDPSDGRTKDKHSYAEVSGQLALVNEMVIVPNRLNEQGPINLDIFPIVGNGVLVAENAATSQMVSISTIGDDTSLLLALDGHGWMWGASFSDRIEGFSGSTSLGNISSVGGVRVPLPIIASDQAIIVNDGAGQVVLFESEDLGMNTPVSEATPGM